MDATDRLFGEIAVTLGHLSREQLAECIRTQYDSPSGTTLGEIALTLGFMQSHDVELVLSQQGKMADRRKAKARAGIVEIDATHGRAEARNASVSSQSIPVQRPPRNQARVARTQPQPAAQPPIAATYRPPSSAGVPLSPSKAPSAPAASAQPAAPHTTQTDSTRPSRRADRTLVGTAPNAPSSPANEAITVIPPPGHQSETLDIDESEDPEVSFESLTQEPAASEQEHAAEPVVSFASIRPARTLRSQSTPPEQLFAGLDDPETSFGALLSHPPKPTKPQQPAVGAAGTMFGVGAPQAPAIPREATPNRPRSGTIAFAAAPTQPTEPAAAKPITDVRPRSGTMQHFRAVTPAQPGDTRPPPSDASPAAAAGHSRAPATGPQRPTRRASAWFSSLPSLGSGVISSAGRLPAREWFTTHGTSDAALAQIPAGPDALLLRAIRAALAGGARDLHLHHGAPISVRMHGDLQPLLGGVALGENAVERTLAEVMTDNQWAQLGNTGDATFAIDAADLGRVRVNAYRDQHGCSAVARLFPAEVPSLAELGLPASLSKLLESESGLVLCTGPVGSGVTTTLSALLAGVVTSRQAHVVTLEEVIEIRLPATRCSVSQRQLGLHAKDIARAVRSAAREDADVVAFGDLRDSDDIALALSLAHGGHMVVAGAHARGAAAGLNRLIRTFERQDQTQARSMLAQSLRAVVAQHLVRRADGNGRVPAIELLVSTPTISDLIRSGAPIDMAELSRSGKGQKLITLEDSLQRLVAAGTVDAAEAKRVLHNQPRRG